jgi:peptide/nickel transport system substrate-binding protein
MIAGSHGGRAILERNPHFHVWSAAARPDGYPDKIVVGSATASRGVRAVLAGKADVAEAFDLREESPTLWKRVQTRYSGQAFANPAPETNFMFMSTKLPPFDRLSVRRALNFAVDRREIERLSRGPKMTCQILPPGSPGYQPYCPYTLGGDRGGVWRRPDLARAVRLIADFGTRGARITIVGCGGKCAVTTRLSGPTSLLSCASLGTARV